MTLVDESGEPLTAVAAIKPDWLRDGDSVFDRVEIDPTALLRLSHLYPGPMDEPQAPPPHPEPPRFSMPAMLTAAEVQAIVRAEIAKMPTPTLTAADVQRIVDKAMAQPAGRKEVEFKFDNVGRITGAVIVEKE